MRTIIYTVNIVVVSCWLLFVAGCVQPANQSVHQPAAPTNYQQISVAELIRQGNYGQVIRVLQPAAKKRPDQGEIWYWLGEAYFGQKKYAQATDSLTKALTLPIDTNMRTVAHAKLAWCSFWTGHHDQAINYFTTALKRDPNALPLYYGRGLSYQYMGRYRESIEDLTYYLRSYPKDFSSYLNRGWSRFYLNQWRAALDDFNQADRFFPANGKAGDRTGILTGQGWCLYFLGRFREARKKLDQALTVLPAANHSLAMRIHRGRAFILAGLGQYEKAYKEILQAAAATPYDTRWDLALLHYLAGNKQMAWHLLGGDGVIGINIQQLDPRQGKGIKVLEAKTDGPAARAGIRKNDIIVAVNNTPVETSQALAERIRAAGAGSRVILTVIRQNSRLTIPVTTGSMEDQLRRDTLIQPILARRTATPKPQDRGQARAQTPGSRQQSRTSEQHAQAWGTVDPADDLDVAGVAPGGIPFRPELQTGSSGSGSPNSPSRPDTLDQQELTGKVIAVSGQDIVIRLDRPGKVETGFTVELFYVTSSGKNLPAGTWKVTGRKNDREITAAAEKTTIEAAMTVGMRAVVHRRAQQ